MSTVEPALILKLQKPPPQRPADFCFTLQAIAVSPAPTFGGYAIQFEAL